MGETKAPFQYVKMVTCGFKYSKNGKRISRDFPTKKDGQDWLRQMQDQLTRGLDYQGSKIKVTDYLPQWLDNAQLTLRLKTVHQYRKAIQNHVIPYLGNLQLKDLTLAGIEGFYSERIQNAVVYALYVSFTIFCIKHWKKQSTMDCYPIIRHRVQLSPVIGTAK